MTITIQSRAAPPPPRSQESTKTLLLTPILDRIIGKSVTLISFDGKVRNPVHDRDLKLFVDVAEGHRR
jgi:hypothetical protein